MKRSKHRIVSQILDICISGASKTRIVYQANLNFRTVNPYMEILIKNELLTVEDGKRISYKTTEKGMDLLHNFREIYSEFNEF